MNAEPLQKFKIIDLSRVGTGRYCTMLLADFGPEVITIEILKGMGYTGEAIQDLRGEKIIE